MSNPQKPISLKSYPCILPAIAWARCPCHIKFTGFYLTDKAFLGFNFEFIYILFQNNFWKEPACRNFSILLCEERERTIMNERIVKVGLVGFGTIGSGVAKLILEDGDSIAKRIGVRLELACVVDIDTTTPRPVKLPDGILTNDLNRLLNDESIEIGIELIGGTTIAKEIQIKMLQAGKNVVTANKALLAEHGNELYNIARQNNKCIAFEASCAGGIPLISAIRSGITANNITAMYGIVNGTCNYILSNMTAQNEEFSVALQQAQKKGYAELDPTLDINGSDSAHKLAILASIAFGYEISSR